MHSEIHFTLAQEYKEKSKGLPSTNGQLNRDSRILFEENSKEFQEAMYVLHLKHSSVLGHEDATREFIDVKEQNKILVPTQMNTVYPMGDGVRKLQ